MTLSIRFRLDPPVQAAGKHHPTDLKTASVERASVTMAGCRKLEHY